MHLAFADRGDDLLCDGGVQTDGIEAVMTPLQANCVQHLQTANFDRPQIFGIETDHAPALGLLELIAINGIVKEVGEIAEEIQA